MRQDWLHISDSVDPPSVKIAFCMCHIRNLLSLSQLRAAESSTGFDFNAIYVCRGIAAPHVEGVHGICHRCLFPRISAASWHGTVPSKSAATPFKTVPLNEYKDHVLGDLQMSLMAYCISASFLKRFRYAQVTLKCKVEPHAITYHGIVI